MFKRLPPMLLLLMICGCAGPEKLRLVVDPAAIPDWPPAPVDPTRPVPPAMLPQVECLRRTGQPTGPSCPGAGL